MAMLRRAQRALPVFILACGCLLLARTSLSFLGPNSTQPSRRDLISAGLSGVVAAGSAAAPARAYELPPLAYAYDALEPSIDKATMEFHHDKHHATYVAGINKATEGMEQPPLLDLIKGAITSGKKVYRNAGGGVWNHDFFWMEMAPPGTGGEPSSKLASAIDEAFGSIDAMKETVSAGAAPAALFGSGWAWIVVNKDGKLEFTTTPNQDNPLMEGVEGVQGIPILGIDVWEHAYYLKYQNLRPAYINAWWDVVNWKQVSAWYDDALEGKAPAVA